jgi:hypothetical protein
MSQGGLLAQMVGKNSKEIITYNKASSPFGSSATPGNQTDIRTTGDVVSGAQFLNPKNWFSFPSGKKGNEITIPSKATGIEAHDLEQFKYLDSNLMVGQGRRTKKGKLRGGDLHDDETQIEAISEQIRKSNTKLTELYEKVNKLIDNRDKLREDELSPEENEQFNINIEQTQNELDDEVKYVKKLIEKYYKLYDKIQASPYANAISIPNIEPSIINELQAPYIAISNPKIEAAKYETILAKEDYRYTEVLEELKAVEEENKKTEKKLEEQEKEIEKINYIPEDIAKRRDEIEDKYNNKKDHLDKINSDYQRKYNISYYDKKAKLKLFEESDENTKEEIIKDGGKIIVANKEMLVIGKKAIEINKKIINNHYVENDSKYNANLIRVIISGHGNILSETFKVPKNMFVEYDTKLGNVGHAHSDRNKYGISFLNETRTRRGSIYNPSTKALDTLITSNHEHDNYDINGVIIFDEKSRVPTSVQSFDQFLGRDMTSKNTYTTVSELSRKLSHLYPDKVIELHVSCCRFLDK